MSINLLSSRLKTRQANTFIAVIFPNSPSLSVSKIRMPDMGNRSRLGLQDRPLRGAEVPVSNQQTATFCHGLWSIISIVDDVSSTVSNRRPILQYCGGELSTSVQGAGAGTVLFTSIIVLEA